jgi:hypothetical protein
MSTQRPARPGAVSGVPKLSHPHWFVWWILSVEATTPVTVVLQTGRGVGGQGTRDVRVLGARNPRRGDGWLTVVGCPRLSEGCTETRLRTTGSDRCLEAES